MTTRPLRAAAARIQHELVTVFPRTLGLVTLARSPTKKVRIALVAVLMLFKAYAPRSLRDRPVSISLDEWGTIWVTDRSELRVAHEIFVDRIYDLPGLPDAAQTILDLGANVGLASVYLGTRYPEARIVAYEADPVIVDRAQRNLGHLENVELRIAAVGGHDGTMTLFRQRADSWATSQYGTGEPFTVAAVALHSLLAELDDVDILKMDIEGAEHDAVAGCSNLRNARLILGELHAVDGRTTDDFFRALDGFDVLEHHLDGGKGTFVAAASSDNAA